MPLIFIISIISNYIQIIDITLDPTVLEAAAAGLADLVAAAAGLADLVTTGAIADLGPTDGLVGFIVKKSTYNSQFFTFSFCMSYIFINISVAYVSALLIILIAINIV